MKGVETLEDLAAKCERAGLEARVEEGHEGAGEDYYSWRCLIVEVPAGSGLREVAIEEHVLDDVASTRFEEFRFVDGFEAIWSPTLDIVECSLAGQTMSWKNVLSIYGRRLTKDVSDPQAVQLLGAPPVQLRSPKAGVTLSIGLPSPEHVVMCGETINGTRMVVWAESEPTLRIIGATIATHEGALSLLQGLVNSVLFAMEREFGIPVHLAPPPGTIRFRFGEKKTPAPSARRYDPEALVLFWYGKTAAKLPLLGFLGFYQMIEYFFPSFSAIPPPWPIRGRGERGDLERVLLHGVTATLIRSFISAEPHRARWFLSAEAQQLTPVSIDAAAGDAALCAKAAERIYRIRCRIVHAKAGGRRGELPLLPFSPEARLLFHDHELVEFCAERVIEQTSTPLVL